MARPTIWVGTPKAERRTMFGGVRTDIWTVAPTSSSSVAMSAAELPAPTTSTRWPAYGRGLRYSAECTIGRLNRLRPGQSGM